MEGKPGPCGCGCALTADTSLGFAFDVFCSDIVLRPLDPWQRWLGIHGLEMLPDGRPRFRQLLVLVARQNGKTEFLVLLSLFWMYVLQVGLILGTSTKLDYARESWLKLVRLARSVPDLNSEIAHVRNANGEQEISTLPLPGRVEGSRYKIAASNEEGGRSLTVARLVEDELRQHRDWSAHDAAENAMNAVPGAQAWAISNAGDDRSVVLNALQEQAVTFIETGRGDYRLGYFGWTAPDGCEVTDPEALAAANPNLGRRIDLDSLVGRAERAIIAGGEQETGFRTEVLCQRVISMDPLPITLEDWIAAAKPRDKQADRPVFGISVAPTLASASIVAAGLFPGKVYHLELASHRGGVEWLVPRCQELAEKHRRARFVLMNTGAAASFLPELQNLKIEPELLSVTDLGKAYGNLQERLQSGQLTHSGAEGFELAIAGAVKKDVGEGLWSLGWRKSNVDLTPIEAAAIGLWSLSLRRAPAPGAWG